jgi:hypothetical protein
VTVADAVPDTVPATAEIVAVPTPTAFTKPLELTVATEGLLLLHWTDVPDMVCPFWSLIVAES